MAAGHSRVLPFCSRVSLSPSIPARPSPRRRSIPRLELPPGNLEYAAGSGDFNADGNNNDYPNVTSYKQPHNRSAYLPRKWWSFWLLFRRRAALWQLHPSSVRDRGQ